MGKFSGLLLASDFDDTLVPTSALRAQGLSVHGVSPENCAALTYFTENGGRFTISTGRSAATFAPYAAQLPLNVPAVVSGGGALYDYSTGRYCILTHLPSCAAADLATLAKRFPDAALELYHEDETVWVLHPNPWSEEHRRTTHSRMCPVTSLDQVALPLHKALFEAPPEQLQALCSALRATALGQACEAVFASPHMLELTARGADKGAMLLHLMDWFGLRASGLCAVGDHQNDLPMLRAARYAFAPENAVAEIRSLPGICLVCAAQDHALQAVVANLDQIFSP
ncbi:HAD-IIB family hydrolase [bacterium 210917-SL.2.15]|nr:HAD-IIB family hydrolase [bacterium 210917-SL.2.15]